MKEGATASIGSEGAVSNANTTTPLFSPPGTDLRMDRGDVCSLGCLPNLNRYFLLVMDKDTEYFLSFPTKSRASPLALLKQSVTFTGRKIGYLRIDGAKEFQSDEIKEYCADNDEVLQLVVAYNHTLQARVEGAIGCVNQHSRTSVLHANKPTRFWDDATKDFSIKKVYLWASTDTRGKLQTPQIACSWLSSAPTKQLPYLSAAESVIICLESTAWSRTKHLVIVSLKVRISIVTLPHLASSSASPSNARLRYKISSPILSNSLSDPSCHTRNTPTIMKEMSKMHEEDAHEDNLIAMETSNQIHTRTQMRAAENAAHSHILEPPDVDTHIMSPLLVRNPSVTATDERDIITLLPSILPPRATSGDDSAAARPSVQHYEAGIDLHANLVDYIELEIAQALARHSVEIGLPKHYAPNHVVPEGKMSVVGIKAKKISSTKAVLIVKFI